VRFVKALAYPQGLKAYWQRSTRLKPEIHVLDAGCGTGISALALREAMTDRGLGPAKIKCFDITPNMQRIFKENLERESITGIEVVQADVLELKNLPPDWRDFDLVISSAMMEYLPRECMAEALSNLKSRLIDGGHLVLFVTRGNWLMKLLIGKWWSANCYTEADLRKDFRLAGFSKITFRRFPFPYNHLSLWGHIVEAE
jgi:SAM-dependent methyltransferase